ncbi:MAG: helicase-associated domain-containing protein [Candidatus Omnitrophota bacterium]
MKQFDINWLDFFQTLPAWDSLPPSARQVFVFKTEMNVLMAPELFGQELPILRKSGFILDSADGRKVKVEKKYALMRRIIRSIAFNPIILEPSTQNLRLYLDSHFTYEERERLVNDRSYYWNADNRLLQEATSVQWLQNFLKTNTLEQWERSRLTYRENGHFISPTIFQSTKNLLKRLMERTEPVAFKDMYEFSGIKNRLELAQTIKAGLRYLLFYAAVDVSMDPVLWIWPGIANRLHRQPPTPPQPVEPEETLHVPFLMEDMTHILVECASEPFRLRGQDCGIFAKVEKQLKAILLPLPDWLTIPLTLPPEFRIQFALNLLHTLDFTDYKGESGKDLRLEINKKGNHWLAQSSKERLRFILDAYRKVRPKPDAKFSHNYKLEFIPMSNHILYYDQKCIIPSELVKLFLELETGRFYSLFDFTHYHEIQNNPFLRPTDQKHDSSDYSFLRRFANTDEEKEAAWREMLFRFVVLRLITLGGASAGRMKDGKLAFAMMEPGRYLLEAANDFQLAQEEQFQVVVQPNFDVVFLAPSPQAEAVIGRFAERIGRRLGNVFQITKKSIIKAAATGLSLEQVTEDLHKFSIKEIPGNVQFEINEWFNSCRNISMRTAVIIRCPDANTAGRVRIAGGSKIKPITDTVLELSDPHEKTALVRKMKESGIFLETKEEF